MCMYIHTHICKLCALCSINYFNGPKYINNQQILFNVYDVFFSQCSHQCASAGIPAILRMIILLKEYKCTIVTVSPSLRNN